MVPGIQGNISFLVCSGTQLMGSWFLKLLFPPTALRCANLAKLVLNLGGGVPSSQAQRGPSVRGLRPSLGLLLSTHVDGITTPDFCPVEPGPPSAQSRPSFPPFPRPHLSPSLELHACMRVHMYRHVCVFGSSPCLGQGKRLL